MKKFFGLKDFLTKRDRHAKTFEHWLSAETSFREDTPKELPVPELPPFEVAALGAKRYLDSIQRDIMAGTIEKVSDPEEQAAYRELLEAGKMTQQQAAEINKELLDGLVAIGKKETEGIDRH